MDIKNNMFKIIKIEETTTVMDYIKQFNINTVVIANKQTKGRGKGNRTWISQKSNNLYMAISMDSSNKNINYFNYCFISAIVMAESLKELINVDVNLKIKWPNDILLNNKKICGILLENDLQRNVLIIGIGVNIDYSPVFDNKMLFPPTNVKREGFIVNKDELIDIFLKKFKKFDANNFTLIKDKLIKYFYNFGKEIVVKNDDREIVGVFKDIDNDGSLILECDSVEKKFFSGDVFELN